MSSEIDRMLGHYGGKPPGPGYAAGGSLWNGSFNQPSGVALLPGMGWQPTPAMTGSPVSPYDVAQPGAPPYQAPPGTNQTAPSVPPGQPVPPSGLSGPFAGGPNVAAMPPMLMQPEMQAPRAQPPPAPMLMGADQPVPPPAQPTPPQLMSGINVAMMPGMADGGGVRPAWDAADKEHHRNVLLDDEARGNLAAQPYPAEWGRMPSDAGSLADALETFGATLHGPTPRMSGMSDEARRAVLMNAATLLGLGHNPFVDAVGRADGGGVDDALGQYDAPPAPGLLDRAWAARPWKGYAENPPSTLPQLGIALGLLHPRLGGAMRDLSMARKLAATGDKPAALPGGMGLPRREVGITNPEGLSLGPTGTYRPETIEQFLAARGGINGDRRPMVPAVNQPANANAAAPSPYKPGSRVAAYEAYLNSLPDGVTPVHFRTFVREFLD